MARILRALRGKERLVLVFWGYCISGTLVVGFLLFWTDRLFPASHRPLAGVITGALFIAYFLWAHISLWMCAFNVERRSWGYAARCYGAVMVIYYFVGVATNYLSGPAGIRRVF